MEIRNTENEIQSLRELYGALQRRSSLRNRYSNKDDESKIIQLPELESITNLQPSNDLDSTAKEGDKTSSSPGNDKPNEGAELTSDVTKEGIITANEIRNTLNTFQERMMQLDPMITKFLQRLQYIDPVTQKSRYGPQTQDRIRNNILLPYQQQLLLVYNQLFDPPLQQSIDSSKVNDTKDHFMTRIDQLVNIETQEVEQERERQRAIELARMQQQQRLSEEPSEADIAQQQLQEAQREEFRRETELLMAQRMTQMQELEQQRTNDRLWVESIPNRKTLIGVQEQLQIFIHSCKEKQPSYKASIRALHTLYAQIVAHPDNEQYRRIRRNHPQFIHDIGQYDGGKEILICSGFHIGYIDNQPCYICTEPNVETDLDGWSDWYNLLKGTLDLIEVEVKK